MTKPASPKSYKTLLLLTLLFGWAGFHRIYVGKHATGILWLLTFGLIGLGWAFDVLAVLTRSFTDRSRSFVLPKHQKSQLPSEVDVITNLQSDEPPRRTNRIKPATLLILGAPLVLIVVALLNVAVDSAFQPGEEEQGDVSNTDQNRGQASAQPEDSMVPENYVEGVGLIEVLGMYDAGSGRVVAEISFTEVPSPAVMAEIAASVMYADREEGLRGGYAIHFYRDREAGISLSEPTVIAEDAVNGDWTFTEVPESFDDNIITVKIRMRDPLLKPSLTDHALLKEWDLLNASLQDDEQTHAEIARQFERSPSEVEQIVSSYIEWSNSGDDYVETFEGSSLEESRRINQERAASGAEPLQENEELGGSLQDCIFQGRMALVSADCLAPWPLTVEEGLVQCSDSGAITFWPSDGDGTIHQLNGQATQEGFEPIDPIWRDNPRVSGSKISLGEILKIGRSLCP